MTFGSAPRAAARPVTLEIHGDRRVDEFHWLREKQNPEVLAYLEAENAYTQVCLGHTEELQRQLYEEMVGRIQETDLSVPYREGGRLYYHRTEQGLQYPVHCRRLDAEDAPEEVLLDQNQRARDQAFYRLGVLRVSPDGTQLAWSEDRAGGEEYELRFRDLRNGREYPERIARTDTSLAWYSDGAHLLYTVLDHAHRPYRVFRHRLGTDPAEDLLLHEELDERFFARVSRTRSGRFLRIELDSRVTSEVHLLAADDPDARPFPVKPRVHGVEYSVEHHGERLYLLTNEAAVNFKLIEIPLKAAAREERRELIPHREDVMLSGVDAFSGHLVVYQREAGLPTIHVRRLKDGAEHAIEFDEPAYMVAPQDNLEFETAALRFHYSSLITPPSVYDYDLETRQRTLRKRTEVLLGYDPADYVSKRCQARARDGEQVPISIVYRRDRLRPDGNPLLLRGYGAYGINCEARFNSPQISLLDRGFVIAIAHVRGGGELGRRWYESGKFLKKQTTFSDFIDCAEYLIAEGYTDSGRLAIQGGSAGGLLIGAVLNQRPELFHAALAQVPFVDVITSMLDETLPLTVIEYDEWGNPNDERYYKAMKHYAPYDNVARQAYPHLLITTGLNDPRVPYFEPAKWCARLRRLKTGDHRLLLKTNMGAGHAGASGRYDALKEVALEYAFLVDLLGD